MRIYVNADVTVVTWVAAIRAATIYIGAAVCVDVYVNAYAGVYTDMNMDTDAGDYVYVDAGMYGYVDVERYVNANTCVDVNAGVDMRVYVLLCFFSVNVDMYADVTVLCVCRCV